MGNLKWTLVAVAYQTGLAYLVSLIIYQLGLVAFYGKPVTLWTGLALVLLLVMLYFIARKPRQVKEKVITLDNLSLSHN